MIKRILVPMDGSEPAMVGMRYALALAKRCEATLLGLYVVDVKLLEGPFLRDLSASVGTAPYVNYEGNIAMLLEERGAAVIEAFEEACAEASVTFESRKITGIISTTIIEQGELADLIVMGRGGEHNQWLEGLLGSTTQSVIRRASQPVLVTESEVLGEECFMAAFDGSHHACSALKYAATMAVSWKMPLHLLIVAEPASADELVTEARGYLQAYNLEVEYVCRQGDVDDEIIAYAKECQADFLAMGAYGHSKIRELVLGSTTSNVLNQSPCPVLLFR
jgi:nucleotide-binding universal stress UspA family protein